MYRLMRSHVMRCLQLVEVVRLEGRIHDKMRRAIVAIKMMGFDHELYNDGTTNSSLWEDGEIGC